MCVLAPLISVVQLWISYSTPQSLSFFIVKVRIIILLLISIVIMSTK